MQDLPKSINTKLYIVAQRYNWQNNFEVRVFDFIPKTNECVISIPICETNLSMEIPFSNLSESAIKLLREEKNKLLHDTKEKAQNIDERIKSLLLREV
ncbi:hypothetical protein C9426_22035 [Serratia sp. S1B]|nr:hypothetical protein C9426_22035 [Serratia sp. S1B]